MKIYLICPVRNITEQQSEEIKKYVELLELDGHEVHYPPRDVNQNDETGYNICVAHRFAMINCDRVDIFWDVRSSGSHFDLGMAFVLDKEVKLVKEFVEDNNGKSYLKVIKKMEEENEI
jgi:hypothetical protein